MMWSLSVVEDDVVLQNPLDLTPTKQYEEEPVVAAELNPFLPDRPQEDLVLLPEHGILRKDSASGAESTEKEPEEGRQEEDHVCSGSERNCLPERNIGCSEDRWN